MPDAGQKHRARHAGRKSREIDDADSAGKVSANLGPAHERRRAGVATTTARARSETTRSASTRRGARPIAHEADAELKTPNKFNARTNKMPARPATKAATAAEIPSRGATTRAQREQTPPKPEGGEHARRVGRPCLSNPPVNLRLRDKLRT